MLFQIHRTAVDKDNIRGRLRHVLRLRPNRFGQDAHDGRRLQRQKPRLSEGHLRDGGGGRVPASQLVEIPTAELRRLVQLLRNLLGQGVRSAEQQGEAADSRGRQAAGASCRTDREDSQFNGGGAEADSEGEPGPHVRTDVRQLELVQVARRFSDLSAFQQQYPQGTRQVLVDRLGRQRTRR